MNGCRVLKLLVGVLGMCCTLMCGLACAGDQDSRFDLSPDGSRVEFDLRNASRREVLDRLFAGRGIEIRWINSSFADERISGRFSGSVSSVARDLLAQTNFVLVHDVQDEISRITRVVVVGPAKDAPRSDALAALAAAVSSPAERKGAPTAAAPSAHGQGSVPQFGRSDAGGPLKPAPLQAAPVPVIPPGTEAPRLIPPPAGAAPPLVPASPGTAAPPLGVNQSTGFNN